MEEVTLTSKEKDLQRHGNYSIMRSNYSQAQDERGQAKMNESIRATIEGIMTERGAAAGSLDTLAAILSGRKKTVTATDIVILCQAFDVEPNTFFQGVKA